MEFIHAATSFVGAHSVQVGAGVGMILGSFATIGAATYLLVQMPVDRLNEPPPVPFRPEHPGWTRVVARYGRNVLGVALIATGAVLAVPSIPPGKSMILIGVMVLDFPGKRRLERRVLGRPKVLSMVNRLRARFGRPPLQGEHTCQAAA